MSDNIPKASFKKNVSQAISFFKVFKYDDEKALKGKEHYMY